MRSKNNKIGFNIYVRKSLRSKYCDENTQKSYDVSHISTIIIHSTIDPREKIQTQFLYCHFNQLQTSNSLLIHINHIYNTL